MNIKTTLNHFLSKTPVQDFLLSLYSGLFWIIMRHSRSILGTFGPNTSKQSFSQKTDLLKFNF